MEALSGMINLAVSHKILHGFEWPEMRITYTLAMFADDVLLMLLITLNNINAAIYIFDIFGRASSLLVKWLGIKAAMLTWESGLNSSKLLGFFFSDDLNANLMTAHLLKAVEDHLAKFKKKCTSLTTRGLIINSLILSTLWFMLTI